MTNIDETIRQLFDKLEQRKTKIKELKRDMPVTWRTNCSFQNCSFQMLGNPSIVPINIQTASKDIIWEAAGLLSLRVQGRELAAKELGLVGNDTIQGYSAKDWFSDFKKRLLNLNIREEESELNTLEKRLNTCLSPEERRRIEVELLLKEI